MDELTIDPGSSAVVMTSTSTGDHTTIPFCGSYTTEQLRRLRNQLNSLKLLAPDAQLTPSLAAPILTEDSTTPATPPPIATQLSVPSILEILRNAREKLGEDVQSRIADTRRLLGPTRIPLGIDLVSLVNERERLIKVRMDLRSSELERLLPTLPEASNERLVAQTELYLLRIADRQKKMREDVLRYKIDSTTIDLPYRRGKKHMIKDQRPNEKHDQKQRIERHRREQQPYYEYLNAIMVHRTEILTTHKSSQIRAAKLAKAVMQYHANLEREEQKRLEKLAKDRLRALKADDEEAYLKLIDHEKDTRLAHLLGQTDEFLKNMTTRVLTQQVNLKRLSGESADEGLETVVLEQPKTDLYGTAHKIHELIDSQPNMLEGGKLKEYQIKGLQWMISLYNNHLNGILADEMGLGKTIQAISLISYLIETKGQTGPFLIIVPLSTMTNWAMEFEKWAPAIVKIEYKGIPSQRKYIQARAKQGHFHVMLTTYEYIIKDKSFLSKIKWLYMIIDEGHRMKNASSKLSVVLTDNYQARFRLILTGTPLQNNLPELWALLNFVLPHIFNSSKTFEEWFNQPFANTGERIELNEEESLLIIRRLHKVLHPFLLRRMKKDVETELPDKIERVIKCPMSALQERLYQTIKRTSISTSSSAQKGFGIRKLNNTVMQLRKICNHPFVFEEVERQVNPQKINNDMLYRAAGKFELLQRILAKFKATGHRVLIFFQMTQIMTIMEDFLTMQNYAYLRLDGSTKAEDRSELLRKFNAPGSPYFIFLLSTRAGGLGLNLQSADTVVIFDSDWNPHQDLQAQDRAHRIGQTKEVRIFRLITLDSVEEYILERAQFKLNIDGKVIQAGKFDHKSTNEEREAMLRAILETENERNDIEAIYDDEELNEIISRSDEELGVFKKMDEDRARLQEQMARRGNARSRLMDDSELPDIYLQEFAETIGDEDVFEERPDSRAARKAKNISYDENISDDQWLDSLEQQETSDSTPRPKVKGKRGRKRKIQATIDDVSDSGSQVDSKLRLESLPNIEGIELVEICNAVIETIENCIDASSGRYQSEIFAELPSAELYPDYYQLIGSPISLAMIQDHIDSGRYSRLEEFIADFDLMFSNAMTYNVEGSQVYEDARTLKTKVTERLGELLLQREMSGGSRSFMSTGFSTPSQET